MIIICESALGMKTTLKGFFIYKLRPNANKCLQLINICLVATYSQHALMRNFYIPE